MLQRKQISPKSHKAHCTSLYFVVTFINLGIEFQDTLIDLRAAEFPGTISVCWQTFRIQGERSESTMY